MMSVANIPSMYDAKIQALMGELPTINFVIDLVGKAVDIAYASCGDGEAFIDALEVATRMARFSKKVSQPNFYNTALVLAPLLIKADEESIKLVDGTSKSVTKYVEGLKSVLFANGYKERWLAMVKFNSVDSYAIGIVLTFYDYILEQILKKPEEQLTDKERMCILGLGYIEVCMRKSSVTITSEVREIYNNFGNKILHKANF